MKKIQILVCAVQAVGWMALLAGCRGSDPSLGAAAKPAESPVRIGILTDTHVGADGSNTLVRLERGYRLFRSMNITNVFNLGDICDEHRDKWYADYVSIRERVYPEGLNEVYVFHNHEIIGYPKDGGENWKKDGRGVAILEEARRKLKVKHPLYHAFELGGVNFFAYSKFVDFKRVDADLAAAAKRDPSKPIFVLNHVPPAYTSAGSEVSGESELRRVLNRYPQVVALSGHVHGTVAHEGKLWQKEFTSIGFGDLKYSAKSGIPHYLAVLELYSDRLVIRRYDLGTGGEYHPDEPWVLHFPYDPANPEYGFEKLARTTPRPAFPDDARLQAKRDHVHLGALTVVFPAAKNPDVTAHYRVDFHHHDGAPHDHSHRTGGGDFARTAAKRRATYDVKVSSGYFKEDETVDIKVTPVGFYGNEGDPLQIGYDVGKLDTADWEAVAEAFPRGPKLGVMQKARSARSFQTVPLAPGRYRIVADVATEYGEYETPMRLLAPGGGHCTFAAGAQRISLDFKIKKAGPAEFKFAGCAQDLQNQGIRFDTLALFRFHARKPR